MLRLPRSVRVFVSTTAINLRIDIDGLVQRARTCLEEDPFNGNIFCFFNRRRDRVKILVWDRNGFWVLCKRLERGRFEEVVGRDAWLEIGRDRLVMLLQGIDTKTWRFRLNFAREIRMMPRDDAERSSCPSR